MIRFRKEKRKKEKVLVYLAAFGLPFVIGLMICVANEVYPFGEQCILHVDMYHQYCPFFTEFMEKVKSGGSLLYSWNLGMGSDFVALYAYYLASPLNWLILFCPQSHVIEFMTLLILIKIGLCGSFFFCYLSGHFKLIGRSGTVHARTALPALVCSTAYALSGFMAAYSWDIMWLDCVALAPLIILGLEKMVKDGKPALYYLTLAVSILANYYMSFMICLFLFFKFLLLYAESAGNGRRQVFQFVWYSILAGGTAAVLLIPEYIVLSYSGSAGISFPESVEWYFNIVAELSRVCMNASVYTGTEHWPNLYTGAFGLLLLVLYGLNRQIPIGKRVTRLLAVVVFWLSFSNNYLDFIWHGFHFPDSLPGREAFLYAFVVLVLGYETLLKWKGTRIWHVAAGVAIWILVLAAGSFVTEESITESYAFWITGGFLLVYGILMLWFLCSRRKYRVYLRSIAFLAAIAELTVNMAVTGFYTTSRTAYMAKADTYQKLLETAEEESGGTFYRVEDTQRKTKNDGALYGYASATQFSSLMNINISHLFQSVYMEGGKNFYCFNGATPLLSAMLGVKYMLSDTSLAESPLCTLVESVDECYLYENTYCLPLGYMVPVDLEELWQPGSGDKITNINRLASALGAKDAMISLVSADTESFAGRTQISVSKEGYYYAAYKSNNSDTLTVKNERSGWSKKYSKATHKYLLELGYMQAGDTVSITNTKAEKQEYYVYKLNLDVLDSVYPVLTEQTMELDSWTDTRVEGHIEVSQAGRLLLSIPYEEGWTLYVDGEKTEIEAFDEALISVELDEGYHEISLIYRTPGLMLGAAVSMGCVLLFVFSMLWRMHKRKREAGL